MEDLKKIQEFFSKPLDEGTLTPDDLAYYRNEAMKTLANADIVDKKLGKTRQGDKYIMIMYKEKWDFANPPKKGMYNPETQWVKVFYNDESEIQDLMTLKENTTNWPKEVSSRYGDIIFRLVKVMSDRAKYELIDAETGKTWETGGRVYGTVNQLKASAEDTIKPQGGRQSSQFESVFEASLGSTKSQSLANAINSAMLQIDDSMSYTDFANAVASILIDEYGTHNFIPFMEVLHARLGMNESLNEADLNNATKEEYNALLDKEYELTKAYSKDKTEANWKKLSDIRKKGKKLEKELEDQGLLEASKTFGHSSDEKKKSIAQTLAETIKLGEGVIEEELCPKGKAYIKRRKAAGEKSSAYLSGRAVKVCKGQMSGRKKRKSKKK